MSANGVTLKGPCWDRVASSDAGETVKNPGKARPKSSVRHSDMSERTKLRLTEAGAAASK